MIMFLFNLYFSIYFSLLDQFVCLLESKGLDINWLFRVSWYGTLFLVAWRSGYNKEEEKGENHMGRKERQDKAKTLLKFSNPKY